MTLLAKAYRDAWIKERKLHLIWRAIARRHLSRTPYLAPTDGYIILDLDGETDQLSRAANGKSLATT